MKRFRAKCHERATLRKLWRQTGNSSLLPLLHVMAGISARSSNFAFVLFCYITNHLMTGPLGNSEFCFLRISMFVEGNSEIRFSFIRWNSRWDSRDNIRPPLITCNSGQHFAGNSELFPVWRHSFCNVARSWHLGGNSFIVRCHVTMNWPMNGHAVAGKTPAI